MVMRMQTKRNPYTLPVGMSISASIMEISMEVLQKPKIEIPYDPAIQLLAFPQRNID
jgi:hypothetical protein